MIFFVSLSAFLWLLLLAVMVIGHHQKTVEDVFPPVDEDSFDDLEHDQDEVDDN